MLNEDSIAAIVAEVLRKLGGNQAAEGDRAGQVQARVAGQGQAADQGQGMGRGGVQAQNSGGDAGVFADLNAGIASAKAAQREFSQLSLRARGEIITAIRQAAVERVEEIAGLAHQETGYGRVQDKVQKKLYAARLTPGIEDIKTEAKSGDGGLILIERAPFGLIASIEPATHPGACVINHAISMLAAGNGIVFLPHPRGIKTTQYLVRLFNQVIVAAGGPENLLVVGDRVSMENLDLALSHPQVNLVVATGGPEVVARALRSGKKAICAGPGNPPVVVDETVPDLDYAAKCIIDGAAFDNTVLCIAEKVIIAVEAIADRLLASLERHGAYLVRGAEEKERLTRAVLPDGKNISPDLVGRDVSVILGRAAISPPAGARVAVMECPPSHPLVQEEQMLPVLPLVRVPDFDAALELAVEVEHGFKHTAIIHSQDVARITAYAQRLGVDILVANGPSAAGLGIGAEGHYSHTIASPTGEGICTPRTYTREQRTVIVGALRTVLP